MNKITCTKNWVYIVKLLLTLLISSSTTAKTFSELNITPSKLNSLPSLNKTQQVLAEATAILDLGQEPSYNLELAPNLFNVAKYSNNRPGKINIIDSKSRESVAQIWLCSEHIAVETKDNNHIVFEGIKLGKQRKSIKISGNSKITFIDKVNLAKIEISAHSIRFHDSLQISEKIALRFKHSSHFDKALKYPLTVKAEAGFIEQTSLAKNPSLHINWAAMTKTSVPFIANDEDLNALLDLVQTHKTPAWKAERLVAMANMSLAEKTAYFQRYIFQPLKDNSAKGLIGESFVKRYLESQGYVFHLTQNNRNQGLDGFFTKNGARSLLLEVKYSSKGTPKPGRENIDGWNWRQLSLPYIELKLKELKLAAVQENSASLTNSLKLIDEQIYNTDLGFFVFNAKDMSIDWYQVGTRQVSKLD